MLLLKATYALSDGMTKILIGSRLKGKALDWFHSKPEYIEETVPELLSELRTMFHHQPSKMERRKLFESRLWRRGEPLSEYFYEKVILANRVPIDDEELVEQIISGIPDIALRNQADMQGFSTKRELLRAFEKIILHH